MGRKVKLIFWNVVQKLDVVVFKKGFDLPWKISQDGDNIEFKRNVERLETI